jgi:hypothetical protein
MRSVIDFRHVRSMAITTAAAAAMGLMIGCGGASPTAPTATTTPAPQARVLLDVFVDVPGPEGCNLSSIPQEFTGQAGRTVTIDVTGPPAMAPAIIVYAPDFATQLRGTTSSRPGAQTMTITLAQDGPHHVDVCDVNSVGGSIRLRVTMPA